MNTLKVTIREKVAVISLNRGKSNAMNLEMVEELIRIIKSIEQDINTKGIILTGNNGSYRIV